MTTSNERGFSAIAAVIMMMLTSIFGFYLSALVTTSNEVYADQNDYHKTFACNQAGLEYGMRKIYEMVDANVPEPGIPFGGGCSFTITHIGRVVTVTSRYGTNEMSHTVWSPTESDCTEIDVSSASFVGGGTKLIQIPLTKHCLLQTTLKQMVVSWNLHPQVGALEKIRIESTTIYNLPPVPSGQPTLITPYAMIGNHVYNMNEIGFNISLSGENFTMTFIFNDDSTETHDFTPL